MQKEAKDEVEECREALQLAERALEDAETPSEQGSGTSGRRRLSKKRPRDDEDRATPSGDRMAASDASDDE